MPNAFHNSGYMVGLVGTIIIGIVCTYCIHMLLRSHYELCKRKKASLCEFVIWFNLFNLVFIACSGSQFILSSYCWIGFTWGSELGSNRRTIHCVSYLIILVACFTLSNYIELAMNIINNEVNNLSIHFCSRSDITNAFLLIYQLGACCIYVVFVASNIKDIADYCLDDNIDVRLFMLIILLPLILINWIRNLKYLAPFSSVANVITIISFAIICYYMFRDPISVEGKHAVGGIKEFPLFFGTVLFALEAIGVVSWTNVFHFNRIHY